jgi:hypothetical protein
MDNICWDKMKGNKLRNRKEDAMNTWENRGIRRWAYYYLIGIESWEIAVRSS